MSKNKKLKMHPMSKHKPVADIEAAEKLLVGIDPGPWTGDDYGMYAFCPKGMVADRPPDPDKPVEHQPPDKNLAVEIRGFGRRAPQEANLRFIIGARNAFPLMIEEIKRLRKLVAGAEVNPDPENRTLTCQPCATGKHTDCVSRVFSGGCCDGVDPCL